jgi:hypothetical protein
MSIKPPVNKMPMSQENIWDNADKGTPVRAFKKIPGMQKNKSVVIPSVIMSISFINVYGLTNILNMS